MTQFQRTWRIAQYAAAALGFTTALAAQCQLAVQPGEPTSGPQGFVSALALDAQGQPVVGGDFLVADGSLCQRIARWNGSSWQPLGSGVDANVGAIARLPNGDLVAGGSFAIAGGQPAAAVARWNGTAWSPMGAGLPGRVTALEVAGNGDVWAGISVQDIASVHRFDGAVWQQVGTDFSAGLIQDLAELPNGEWLAGGLIGTAGGQQAFGLARWNGAIWQPTSGLTNFARVDSIAVRANGDIVVGGALRVGAAFGSVATIDAVGTQIVPAPLGASAAEVGLLPNGDVVAGTFLPDGPSSSQVTIARWDGTTWTALSVQQPLPQAPAFSFPTPSRVMQLEVDAIGRVVVNDNFRIRRLEAGSWSLLGGPLPPQINAMTALASGDFVAGGLFSSLGGVPAANVARWNGSAWSPLGLGVDGTVQAIASAPNGDLIVGGNFAQAGGGAANKVARFDGTFWTTLGAGLPNAPIGLAVGGDGSVFAIGGGLGAPMSRFDGQSWSPLSLGGLLGSPQRLAVGTDGNVLVAGQFGGAPSSVSLLRWNGTALAPVPNAPVGLARGVAVDADGSVILVGTFLGNNNNVVRLTAAGVAPVGSPSLSGQVLDVAILADGDLVVAGVSMALAGVPIGPLARFDGTSWAPLDLGLPNNALAGQLIDVAATGRGELFLAGSFGQLGNVVSAGIARAVSPCPAAATPIGAGCVGAAGAVTLAAQNRPWVGGTFRARLQTLPANALALHVVGFQPFAAALPLSAPGCSLLVDPVAIALVVPNAGVGAVELAVPASVSAVGLSLRSQGIGAELDAQGNLLRTTSSNALLLVVGAL